MRRGSKQIDVSALRALLRDERMWAGVGIVTKPDDSNQHYEIDSDRDDVLVCCKASPSGVEVWARLGGIGGGAANLGVWRIPPVGAEVVLLFQEGYVEGDVFIVGTLSTGSVPSDVDADALVITNTKRIVLKSTDATVEVNGSDYSLIKTEDFLSDLKAFVTAVITDLASAAAAPVGTYSPTLNTTQLFARAVTGNGEAYKSSKAKNG